MMGEEPGTAGPADPNRSGETDSLPAEDLPALFAALYDELRELARGRLARLPPGRTLQATALVNEAYLRVSAGREERWSGRRHFFYVASRAMRDIIVEDVRRKAAAKRGGPDRLRVTLAELGWDLPFDLGELLDLDDALRDLERTHPEHHRIVLLRFFAGLELAEIAEVTGLSLPTIQRRWRASRAHLLRALGDADGR